MKEVLELNSVLKIKAEKVDNFTDKITISGTEFKRDEFTKALIFGMNKIIGDICSTTGMDSDVFSKEYRNFTQKLNAL